LAAIEQATGKINILLARNPATALIPVSLEVEVIDAAPHDSKAIAEIAKNASKAVDDKNYPAARVLLYALTSEIRVRTYNLPLATYPAALQEAAHLLDQKEPLEASKVLLTALDTLMAVDRVTPLPLFLAREAIEQAKAKSRTDKAMAQTLVETAKKETERAKELGYAGRDPEYVALNTDISNLEKQLKGNEDATSVFRQARGSIVGVPEAAVAARAALTRAKHRPRRPGLAFNASPAFRFSGLVESRGWYSGVLCMGSRVAPQKRNRKYQD